MEDFLLKWNVDFPFDRLWRQKYNIPLFSEQHLNACQIDIYLEFLEEELYEKHLKIAKDKIEKTNRYKEGIILTPLKSMTSTDEELFSKLSTSLLGKK